MDQELHPQDLPAKTSSTAPPVSPPAAPASGAPEPASGAGHIDIGKILLPKKEVPGATPQSAQRINAGALLEQEQTAVAEGIPHTAPAKTPPNPSAAPAPAKEAQLVQPLETYRGDIEQLVQDKNVSVLSIATAEAERRGTIAAATIGDAPGAERSSWRMAFMVAGGILLLAAASGLLAYIVSRPTSTPVAGAPAAPFISVDGTATVLMTPGEQRNNLMSSLVSTQAQVSLSLGLIEWLLPVEASSTVSGGYWAVDAPTLLAALSPNIPQNLLLTLQPQFLLGIHAYNGNQAFLMLKVDSYEQAYAGMLAWESTMYGDLQPLFAYTPPPDATQAAAGAPATTSPQFIQSGFVDTIIENHDARAMLNQQGDVILFWTFLDRNTVVITTNAATLQGIITRLQTAPTAPLPTQ